MAPQLNYLKLLAVEEYTMEGKENQGTIDYLYRIRFYDIHRILISMLPARLGFGIYNFMKIVNYMYKKKKNC